MLLQKKTRPAGICSGKLHNARVDRQVFFFVTALILKSLKQCPALQAPASQFVRIKQLAVIIMSVVLRQKAGF